MTENRDAFVLLKCVESQFTEGILDGKFYFARNSYFIDLEEKQIDKGIGDKREGVWSRVLDPKKDKLSFITEDGVEIPFTYNRCVFRQTSSELKHCPICCFVMLSVKNDFIVNEEKSILTLRPEVERKLSEQFAGRDLILITNMDEFIERMDVTCKKEKLGWMRGRVAYYDDETECHPLSREEAESNPVRTLLYKRKFFEFQKEFRYILKTPQDNDKLLDVGNIRDIAYNLGTIKKGKFQIGFRYSIETMA
ncbi:hypothetical protein OCE55_03710 [Bacillus paranthracis]|uniref:hypothetical protein n=1 Tax=Bacillus cereus group TaxID=86661 RepID=UPI000BFE5334|nr:MULTISPECIES: hypothetical protein [Bacillus cereus group]MBJ7945698.1 hypothetical protein [Bacillus cereus group sp. N24]MCU5387140.1 hypothetical protein [Bacillus paranthracis]PGJ00011.1 hypothetical protein CN898_05175 [Bacillus thuringiensis]